MLQSLFARQREPRQKVVNVSPKEAESMLQSDTPPLLIDVRSAEEFKHDGHIQGARLLPLATLPVRMDEVPQGQSIIVVCRSGARSTVAAERLLAAGYDDVLNLQGGMMGWQQTGLPVRR